MIPGNGYQVRYARDQVLLDVRPVVAFGDDGDALVIGNRHEGIVRARSMQDFGGVEPSPPPVVAAVGGAGWRVRRQPEGGDPVTEQVVVWLVHADGAVVPVTCDPTGHAAAVPDSTPFVVLPPGGGLPAPSPGTTG